MCSNSFLSQLTLRTKYHRIQGVRDCLVMDIHHGFFRTFCTDWSGAPLLTHFNAIWDRVSRYYPSFGERFVVGLFYEVTVALITAGTPVPCLMCFWSIIWAANCPWWWSSRPRPIFQKIVPSYLSHLFILPSMVPNGSYENIDMLPHWLRFALPHLCSRLPVREPGASFERHPCARERWLVSCVGCVLRVSSLMEVRFLHISSLFC